MRHLCGRADDDPRTSRHPSPTPSLAAASPATYALSGVRDAILGGIGIVSLRPELLVLGLIGAVTVLIGMMLFAAGERYAKQHGKLKALRLNRSANMMA